MKFVVILHFAKTSRYFVAGIHTIVVEAESYAEVLEKIGIGLDCQKVEITQVTKEM